MTPSLFSLVREWALERGWYVSDDTGMYFLNIGPSKKHEYLSIYEDGKVCCSDIKNGKVDSDNIRYVHLKPGNPKYLDELEALVLAEPLDTKKIFHPDMRE
jgi:hypothetical protein